jgi:hypothetical protein
MPPPVIALLGLLSTAGIQPARQQPTPPATPERGVDLLSIDFRAVTNDGRPVTNLTAEEVTIRISGRARPVRTLQRVAVADADPAIRSSLDSPPPFGTNATSDNGRTILLAVETNSFRPGREAPLRAAVDRLIAGLGPRDRISLVDVPYGGVKVPMTSDHSRVRTAMSLVVGQGSADESGSDLACRTRTTLETLVGHLTTLRGREAPSVVVIATAGMAGPRRDAPIMLAPGRCELTSDMFQQVGAAAADARAQVYVVQADDIMIRTGPGQRENIAGAGFTGSENPLEGLENLTGTTGGRMLRLTGAADPAGVLLQESAAYYLAAIEPERIDREGRLQPLDIRVTRPGVDVRSRPTVRFAQVDRLTAPRPPAPSPREMLGTTAVFRDLPLRVSAYSSPDAESGVLKVLTLTEAVEPSVKFGSLVAALFDRDNKLVSNWVATPADLESAVIIGAMPAEPGFYRLRIAAIDTTGRAGTADYDVSAEIVQTGSLKLSSLVLGLSRQGGFVPRLQFSTEPVVIAHLEMYGAAPGTRLTAALELSGTLNGPSMLTVPLTIERAAESRYIATAAVPIGSLAPGDYVVRAVVGIEGQAPTRVVRTLRKVQSGVEGREPRD